MPCLSIVLPVVTVDNSKRIVNENSNVTLSFGIFSAYPPVTSSSIIWIFTPAFGPRRGIEIQISSSAHYIFSRDKLSLFIPSVELTDRGTYTLRAINSLGTGSADINLNVLCKIHCILVQIMNTSVCCYVFFV